MNSRILNLLCQLLWVLFCAGLPHLAAAAVLPDSAFKPVLAAPARIAGIAPLANGQALVVGSFTSINGTAGNQVVRLKPDGSLDATFRPDPSIEINQVTAVAAQGDGKVLIGGYLTRNGATRIQSYLFRLNSDGSVDTGFDAGGFDLNAGSPYGLDNLVRAILIDADGKILVGGDFTAPGNHIARLNSDGSVDTDFDAGSGADGAVTHLARQSTGHLIAGGSFTTLNGTGKAGIARLSADGTLDPAFGSGLYGGSLGALAVQADDKILLGGTFTAVDGVDTPKLTRRNADGTEDSSFTQITPTTSGATLAANMFQAITSLVALPDRIVVGGWYSFTIFNGQPTEHNARIFVLNSSTGAFVNSAAFKGKPTDVLALARRSDGSVLAGGSFTQLDDGTDAYYYGVCRLSGSSLSLDGSFKPIFGGQADVRTITQQADGKYLLGGDFYLANGTALSGIARLNPDGTVDASLKAPAATGGMVTGLLARDDGKLIVGGTFYAIGTLDFKDIAVLSATGAIEQTAYVGGVNALAWYEGGKVVAATPHAPGVIRLIADPLSADSGFIPGSGISNEIQPDAELDRANAVAVQADGKILVGGSFGTFSGAVRQNLVRLNADGSIDPGFTSPTFTVVNFRSEIFSIAVQDDGKILVAGRFSTVNGEARPTLARLNADGSVDTSFTAPMLDSGATAYRVRVLDDGKILVGGNFQVIEGESIYNSLVLLNGDGSRAASYTSSVTGIVKDVFGDGARLLAGGTIAAADGSARFGVARFIDPVAPTATTAPATEVRTSSATLHGVVNSNLTATTFHFEYGLDQTYGSTLAGGTVSAGTGETPVSAALGGLAPETTYHFRVVATNDGGTSYGSDATFTTSTGAILINGGAAITATRTVTVTLNEPGAARMQFLVDKAAAWTQPEPYAPTKTIKLPAANGLKVVSVQFIHAQGHSPIYSAAILLDSAPPTGSIRIDNGAPVSADTDLTLQLGVNDATTGAASMRISEDGESWTDGSWVDYAASYPYALGTLPAGGVDPGVKTVHVQFRDGAGNVSKVYHDTIVYDPEATAATQGTVAINDGAAFTRSKAVDLQLSPPNGETQVRLANDVAGLAKARWVPVATVSRWRLTPENGLKSVFAQYSSDKATPGPIYYGVITLDTVKPAGGLVINDGAAITGSTTLDLRIGAVDVNGVPSMCLREDASKCGDAEWENYASSRSFSLAAKPDALRKVFVSFRDAAGNVSKPVKASIRVDTTPPVGTVTINGGQASTVSQSVTLKLSASKAAYVMISADGGNTWGEWEAYARTKTATLPPGAGEKTVSVRFMDYAENISGLVSDTIRLQ